MIDKVEIAALKEIVFNTEKTGTMESRKVYFILSAVLIICEIQDKESLELFYELSKKYLRNFE